MVQLIGQEQSHPDITRQLTNHDNKRNIQTTMYKNGKQFKKRAVNYAPVHAGKTENETEPQTHFFSSVSIFELTNASVHLTCYVYWFYLKRPQRILL